MVLLVNLFDCNKVLLDFWVQVRFVVCRVGGVVTGFINYLVCLTLIFVDIKLAQIALGLFHLEAWSAMRHWFNSLCFHCTIYYKTSCCSGLFLVVVFGIVAFQFG